MRSAQTRTGLSVVVVLMLTAAVAAEESWLQLKFDSRHSGNVPDRSVTVPLGLAGAVRRSFGGLHDASRPDRGWVTGASEMGRYLGCFGKGMT